MCLFVYLIFVKYAVAIGSGIKKYEKFLFNLCFCYGGVKKKGDSFVLLKSCGEFGVTVSCPKISFEIESFAKSVQYFSCSNDPPLVEEGAINT